MCSQCARTDGWTRRSVLLAGAALGASAVLRRPVAAAQGLEVLPREAWAGDDRPAGLIADEPDVRVLVVHHTVDRNDYLADHVPGLLRDIHGFHTGPERGWPDIAYNFIVDRFGRAWETRAGSLQRPVAGDATGGNQGFDQKCAFLGDHRTDAPSPEATATMVALLAFLADRSDVDTRPGARATFPSRGSNLHPAGTSVDTSTITGHRALSRTACPGNAAFVLVQDRFPAEVTASRGGTPTTTSTSTTSTSSPPAPSTPTSTQAPPATSGPRRTTPRSPSEDSAAGGASASGGGPPWPVLGAAGGLGAVALGGVLALRARALRR